MPSALIDSIIIRIPQPHPTQPHTHVWGYEDAVHSALLAGHIMRGSAQEALDQINSKDYAIPYQAESKPVIKIGIAFSQETKTFSDWMIEKD